VVFNPLEFFVPSCLRGNQRIKKLVYKIIVYPYKIADPSTPDGV